MPPLSEMVTTPDPARHLRSCTGWIVTDGRMGTAVTASGIAAELGLNAEHKRVVPRSLWSTLPSWTVLDPRERFDGTISAFAPPWPEIAIAAGRGTIPYLTALRRASEGATYTVILQHPRTRTDIADLIWCPAHERVNAPNVISTLTSPHGMRPHRLAALRRTPVAEIESLGRPLTAVLLGGNNRVYTFDAATLERLAECLHNLAMSGGSFLITPSRRTTAALLRTVTDATKGAKRIIWAREGSNPYWTFLAHADLTVVTADSVNMTSEACVTGRPVYVFEPSGGSEKFNRFHAGLRAYGATRSLTTSTQADESWSYAPLDAAPPIAGEILRRFNAARAPCGYARRKSSALSQSGF
jgi:uncharacterized protein